MLKLSQGRNDLENYLYNEERLVEVLTEGRYLESDFHDTGGSEHMHWYRKILETYNPETRTVLLSNVGSRRIMGELETPDKKFSLAELRGMDFIKMSWKVRETDYPLY